VALCADGVGCVAVVASMLQKTPFCALIVGVMSLSAIVGGEQSIHFCAASRCKNVCVCVCVCLSVCLSVCLCVFVQLVCHVNLKMKL